MKLSIVLQQIGKDAGSLLDAEVVRVCAALFREKRLVLPGLNWERSCVLPDASLSSPNCDNSNGI
jgi:hypothetical protein